MWTRAERALNVLLVYKYESAYDVRYDGHMTLSCLQQACVKLSNCSALYKQTSVPFKPQTHTHTITEQSRMISVNPCQTQLPLFCDVHTHTRTKTHQAHKCRGLTPEDNMSGKDLRTHFRLGWAIERSGGPLGCWSLPTLRLPLLLHRRSTASSWWGQSDRDESILCWHSRM